ncbi:hypothetical protein P152DRAFT_450967 [Eremomyces bilateralis CBS 781.70]|uniref:Uncharacterized protein n=1 Tax=Eremomyces bilateralis CBS 781.70 TaxID=1392243 RepID=A0A6G1FY44_9PEZI|nr:uncharacterized protein P152DRAFT_450967 [Eremomyces bilateralis CBS 781.70]KAF1810596.1 hypothetical protein P152DRAFT_450967 [Eremomyces bilateralis CBS 781.70]
MSQQSKPSNHQDWRKNLSTNYLPLLALTPVFAVAITMLCLVLTQWHGSERVAHFAEANRAEVAIAVQVISSLLGLLEIAVLCAILRLSYSCYASQNRLSLRSLQFAFAVNSQTFTWSLPFIRLSVLLGSMAIALLPAAIWSGAITPISVSYNNVSDIQVPSFRTSNVSSLWDAERHSSRWQTEKGLFSYDAPAMRGLLLNSASGASVVKPQDAIHAKLDKTGFVYKGRSYGMGAAAGLVDLITAGSTVQAIFYVDEGFESVVSCHYNRSSAYRLERMNNVGSLYSIYWLKGYYPNGAKVHVEGETIYSARKPYDIFSWGAAYSRLEKVIYLPMASPATPDNDKWSFSEFNATQCEIRFTPRRFNVEANYTSSEIRVTPGSDIPWPNYSDAVIEKIRYWLWAMSYVDGGFGGSQLGRSLRLNVDKLQASRNISETTTMRAIEDYVASLVDNILIGLVSTRMIVGNESAPVSMRVTAPAMKLGDLRFIIGVFAMNLMLLLLYCVEALRTRFWGKCPDVDLFDLTGLVKGISDGSLLITPDSENDHQRQSFDLWVSVLPNTDAETENAKLLDRIVIDG